MDETKKREGLLVGILKKLKIDPSDFSLKSILAVIGVFMVGFVVLGVGNMAIGQFTNPMAEEFGVGRSVITLYSTFSKVAGGIASLVFAGVYKKVGPKGLALIAGSALMAQFALMAMAKSPTWVWIGAFIGGFGVQFAGGMMIFTIIKPWFSKNLGIFSAICGTASGFGGSLFTKRIANIIVNSGWRNGAWSVVPILAILIFIPILLINAAPNDPLYSKEGAVKGTNKDKKSIKKDEKTISAIPALGYKDYLKCPATWILMAMMLLAAGTNHPYMQALNGIADWKGLDGAVVGAAAFALYSLWLVWAKFGMGLLRDFAGMNICIALAWGTNLISVAGYLFINNMSPEMFKYLAAINSFAGTSTQLLIGYAIVQAYGKYYNARVHGLVVLCFNIGRAIGAPLIHLPYDITGSYAPTLWILLVVAVLMFIMNHIAIRIGNKTVKQLDVIYADKNINTNAEAPA